jgi:hypothetical protein
MGRAGTAWRALSGAAAVALLVLSAAPAAAAPAAAPAGEPGPAIVATAEGGTVAFDAAGLAPDSLVTLTVRARAVGASRTLAAQTDGAGGLHAAALLCSRIARLPLEVTATDEAGGAARTDFFAPAC